MAAFPYPAPTGPLGWIHEGLSWLYTNVLWGMVAILLGTFTPLLFGVKPQLPNDATLAVTVLAITICATHIDFPTELRVKHKYQLTWLTRAAVVFIFLGAVIAAFSTANTFGDALKLDRELMLILSAALFVVAVLIGLWLSVLRRLAFERYLLDTIRAAHEGTYAVEIAQAREDLVDQARTATKVDDVKL